MPVLSHRAAAITPSPTLTLDSEAKALKDQGVDVVNLSIGEPDFPSPDSALKAAVAAIETGFTRYTAPEGILPLREAIGQKFKKDNGLDYSPDQIVVAAGGKYALYGAFQCLLNPGDEAIVPSPYWVTYPVQIALAGATPVFAPTDPERLILTPEGLKQALSPRSKVLVLNSPANPSGRAYTAADLEKLAPIVKERNLWVISDDIYENLIYDDLQFVNLAMVRPDLKDQVVVCHGVSKTYSMTGWRIGYLAGPKEVAQAVARFQSHTTSNPASVSQKAALAALTGPQEIVALMRRSFADRRQRVLELVRDLPGWDCPTPQGAFYLFPKVASLFGQELYGEIIQSSNDLARLLLAKAKVATTPGEGFGAPDRLRLSYAASLTELEKGFRRIKDFLAGQPPFPDN